MAAEILAFPERPGSSRDAYLHARDRMIERLMEWMIRDHPSGQMVAAELLLLYREWDGAAASVRAAAEADDARRR